MRSFSSIDHRIFAAFIAGLAAIASSAPATDCGPVLLRDINLTSPGAGSRPGAYPPELTSLGNVVVFGADDGVIGDELWATDGTPAGTMMIAELNPGSFGSNPREFVVLDGIAYFRADIPGGQGELFRTDGTPSGTQRLSVNFPGLSPRHLVAGDTVVYFAGFRNATGIELWKTDGTVGGTQMILDYQPGTISFRPQGMVHIGLDVVIFAARNGDIVGGGNDDEEIFVSDGTPSGTKLVFDLEPGDSGSGPRDFVAANGFAFFEAFTPTAGLNQLWRTDGTALETISLGSFGDLEEFAEFQNRMYFGGNDFTFGRELWATDGSLAGTVLVRDINPGTSSASSTPEKMTPVGANLFFTADTGILGDGRELWMTDGTELGTVQVKNINPGNLSSNPSLLFDLEGTCMFIANDNSGTGFELWRSDGTEVGTFLTRDFNPGNANLGFTPFSRIGNRLILFADNGVIGSEPHYYPLDCITSADLTWLLYGGNE